MDKGERVETVELAGKQFVVVAPLCKCEEESEVLRERDPVLVVWWLGDLARELLN